MRVPEQSKTSQSDVSVPDGAKGGTVLLNLGAVLAGDWRLEGI
jgi:hypothetical protein